MNVLKEIIIQMEKDKKEHGTEQWEGSIHNKNGIQHKRIDALNYFWLYIHLAKSLIQVEWSKQSAYKNHNVWFAQDLKLHKCKITRMIMLEVVELLKEKENDFLNSLSIRLV